MKVKKVLMLLAALLLLASLLRFDNARAADTFKDGSGRSNYFTRELFHR